MTLTLPLNLSESAFFVATGYIDGSRPFWWDRISFIVRGSPLSHISLSYPEAREVDCRPDPEPAIRLLLAIVKSSFDLDVERFLDELATAAEVSEHAELDARHLLMSWDDVRRLRDAGMEIQSHTRSHRVLSTLRAAELDAELGGSREDLARELGSPPCAISYPVGQPIGDRPELVAAVRSAGYSVGFSTGVSWQERRVNPLDMGRAMLDRGLSDAQFRALLVHPSFAST